MQILFCSSFLKSLKKVRSISTDDITTLLAKYPNTTEIKNIDVYQPYDVLKCYLFGKRVRMMVLAATIKGKYVPFAIVKKETKKGHNITKDNYIELFGGDIKRILTDVQNGDYVTEEV